MKPAQNQPRILAAGAGLRRPSLSCDPIPKQLMRLVGANNFTSAATPQRQQDNAKRVVAHREDAPRTQVADDQCVHRPWGHYNSLETGERFQVKCIVVNPGARLSLQKHHHRAEHWVVVRGTAEVTVGEKVMRLYENEWVYVPVGAIHRLANPGKIPLKVIEVQSGSYLGEDDIVRFEDDYHRESTPCANDELHRDPSRPH